MRNTYFKLEKKKFITFQPLIHPHEADSSTGRRRPSPLARIPRVSTHEPTLVCHVFSPLDPLKDSEPMW